MKNYILFGCIFYILLCLSIYADADNLVSSFFENYPIIAIMIFIACIFYIIRFLMGIHKQVKINAEKLKKSEELNQRLLEEMNEENIKSAKIGTPIARIKKKHEDFSDTNFYYSTKGIIDDFFIALNSDSIEKLDYFCTKDFIESEKYKIINKDNIFINYLFDRRKLAIVDYKDDTDEIILETSYKKKKTMSDVKTGEEIKGLTRFVNKTIYVSVVESSKYSKDAVHCPNCGAPLDYYLATRCNYCNNDIVFNREWIINDLEESHING